MLLSLHSYLYTSFLLFLKACPISKLEPRIACSIFTHTAQDLLNIKVKDIHLKKNPTVFYTEKV